MHESPNETMAAAWNGPSGQAWVEEQPLLDRTYESIETMLADAAVAHGARQVLDIGCGSGATTLAVARALGARGQATGVDISAPLIELARARAQRAGSSARFIHADAQTHAFAPASFDFAISRFGVMFFDDPVAAFTNLRRAASGNARLRLVVFRAIGENAFMTTAERAAAPLLGNLPQRKPDAPGQFAFADEARVRGILEAAGWTRTEFAAVDIPCSFPAGDLERFFTRLGPLGQVLRDEPAATRKRIIRAVRAAFDPYVRDGEVRFTSACWMISARAA
ncbi:MAG TPA: class I SAM-dependent methyltransferase [Steroidobacteraceae bacterium]|nr:class I SAM-dependent methyltransferase [Steroidobacteraceae bacterium]